MRRSLPVQDVGERNETLTQRVITLEAELEKIPRMEGLLEEYKESMTAAVW